MLSTSSIQEGRAKGAPTRFACSSFVCAGRRLWYFNSVIFSIQTQSREHVCKLTHLRNIDLELIQLDPAIQGRTQ
jgi:hypothetical protein